MLLVNVQPNRNHWLTLALEGTQSNRDGIGATVTLRTPVKRLTQQVRSGGSYLSSSDLRPHFGLGEQTSITDLNVVWPDGLVERFPAPRVDQVVHLKEGSGTRIEKVS